MGDQKESDPEDGLVTNGRPFTVADVAEFSDFMTRLTIFYIILMISMVSGTWAVCVRFVFEFIRIPDFYPELFLIVLVTLFMGVNCLLLVCFRSVWQLNIAILLCSSVFIGMLISAAGYMVIRIAASMP